MVKCSSNIGTGLEANTMLVNDGSGNNHLFHLYVREKDPKAELWDGARSGTQAAIDVFNADEVSQAIYLFVFSFYFKWLILNLIHDL